MEAGSVNDTTADKGQVLKNESEVTIPNVVLPESPPKIGKLSFLVFANIDIVQQLPYE